ncbi:unnamed protein product [Toxocara canis]|uniref:Uncharacterized protein n=1 Tax=Toxocara canis TaxID=6265 RepID=A0A183V3X3_TOXCA|nr:unnamed protein product [Toxocara canis]
MLKTNGSRIVGLVRIGAYASQKLKRITVMPSAEWLVGAVCQLSPTMQEIAPHTHIETNIVDHIAQVKYKENLQPADYEKSWLKRPQSECELANGIVSELVGSPNESADATSLRRQTCTCCRIDANICRFHLISISQSSALDSPIILFHFQRGQQEPAKSIGVCVLSVRFAQFIGSVEVISDLGATMGTYAALCCFK